MSNVCIIGSGYVGLVGAACLAEVNNDVICVDIDREKIKNLVNGIVPIYEPGLTEMILKNVEEGKLHFTSDSREGVEKSDVIISAVGTPPGEGFRADLKYVKQVATTVGEIMTTQKVFVTKSTVPVGTGEVCRDLIVNELLKRGLPEDLIHIVSNPEFLREGVALNDFMEPDRILVGAESQYAYDQMREVYQHFIDNGAPYLEVGIRSAELTKYAANSILALGISFMNEVARLADRAGADIMEIREGMNYDHRINAPFSGVGFGGSCFPKDVKALENTGKDYGIEMKSLRMTDDVNEAQKELAVHKLIELMPDISDKQIAVLGLSFKPNTDDMREATSLVVVNLLKKLGAKIKVYDPVAMQEAKKSFKEMNLLSSSIEFANNEYETLIGADAVILLTEWDDFKNIDLKAMSQIMQGNIIIDGRNIWDLNEMKEAGFIYSTIGRGSNK